MSRKIVIIGGNAAGAAAAAKAKRVNPDAVVTIFEKSPYISTGTCELPYVLSGEIESAENIIFFTPEKFRQDKGVDVFVLHEAKSINRRQKKVVVKNILTSTEFEVDYDKLILCMGSRTNSLENFDAAPENIFGFKSVVNLLQVQKVLKENASRKDKFVIVFGAGYIGLEVAESLIISGYQVIVIEKSTLPLPSAEKEISLIIKQLLINRGVEFYSISETSIKYTVIDNCLAKIKVDGRLKEVLLAVNCSGSSPAVCIARDSGLEIGVYGALKVNNRQQTSDPNIYAAGDNVEIVNAISNRPYYLPLATIAREQGYTAGENASGGNKVFATVVPNTAFRLFDSFYSSVGLKMTECNYYNIPCQQVQASCRNLVAVMPQSKTVFGKIIYEKHSRKILGASFFGGTEVSGYADMIAMLIKINGKIEQLKDVNYNYTPALSPFNNLLANLVKKYEKQ